MNNDMTYCNGKGCAMRENCARFVEGKALQKRREPNNNWWMDSCDEHTRDGYIKI